METSPYFFFLCQEERRHLYDDILKSTPYDVRYTASVEHLLADAMRSPPLAIVVDLRSQVAIGPQSINVIFHLDTVWPVMRCNIRPNGSATVMCLEPHRTEELLDALAGINAGQAEWVPKGKYRKFLRFDLQLRGRWRSGDSPWKPTNTLDVSANGTFMVSYDRHEPDQPIELELRDLTDNPLLLSGAVKWIRTWDDTPQLPGVGISLDPTGDIATLIDEVAKRYVSTHKF